MLAAMILTILLALLGTAKALPAALSSELVPRQANYCPLYLPTGSYEYPHLMVTISALSPDASMGNTYSPSMSPNDIATIFNFDIPASRANQNCTLWFTFPTQSQLVTSSYGFAGLGTFVATLYRSGNAPVSDTTWATQPALSDYSAMLKNVIPGTSHKIWEGTCDMKGVFSWRMQSLDSCFWYFQDWNECAIGAYIVYDSA